MRTLFWGVFVGLLGGAVAALVWLPSRKPKPIISQVQPKPIAQPPQAVQAVTERTQELLAIDPLEDSAEAGKLAARRRLTELGLRRNR
jgi:hypothetical protein